MRADPETIPGPAVKSTLPRLKTPACPEESDIYPHVIATLNPRWRVIVCKGGIQWILQCRRGPRWGGYSFCRTREALVRCARAQAGEIAADALVILLSLPERIGGAR